MKKLSLVGVFLFFVLMYGCSPQVEDSEKNTNEKSSVLVGLSLATLRDERWEADRDLFVERVKESGGSVIVLSANDDANLQNSQAENLILQGVDVLVVVAQDGEKIAEVVDTAHKAGIAVIAYDRLIKNSDLDYYISFDNVKVGEYQAKGVLDVVNKGDFAYIGGSPTDNNAYLVKEGSFKLLQPKIDSGEINLVLDTFTPDWRSELAYESMKDYLKNNPTIDGVVAANDGTASGVIQALSEFGLAGKVPVSGQDASLAACQRVVEGKQAVTIYKPIQSIAYQAADMAISVARGNAVATNNLVNNGKVDVPSVLLDVVAVTKDNMMETIIKDGFHTYEEVYQNILAGGPPK